MSDRNAARARIVAVVALEIVVRAWSVAARALEMAARACHGTAGAVEMADRAPLELASEQIEFAARRMPSSVRLLSASTLALLNFASCMDMHGFAIIHICIYIYIYT